MNTGALAVDPLQQVEIERQLRIELASGERLLWAGMPRQGLLLRSSDALGIPFSLFWAGFAIFWEAGVWRSAAPFFFRLWGIPFILVGLYMVFGRFIVDAWIRARTYYGVTDQRILILNGFTSRQVKSLSLRATTDLSLSEHANGSGTIMFGANLGSAGFNAFNLARPGSIRNLAPAFELAGNARSVYQLIRQAQHDVS